MVVVLKTSVKIHRSTVDDKSTLHVVVQTVFSLKDTCTVSSQGEKKIVWLKYDIYDMT